MLIFSSKLEFPQVVQDEILQHVPVPYNTEKSGSSEWRSGRHWSWRCLCLQVRIRFTHLASRLCYFDQKWDVMKWMFRLMIIPLFGFIWQWQMAALNFKFLFRMICSEKLFVKTRSLLYLHNKKSATSSNFSVLGIMSPSENISLFFIMLWLQMVTAVE